MEEGCGPSISALSNVSKAPLLSSSQMLVRNQPLGLTCAVVKPATLVDSICGKEPNLSPP